MIHNVACKIVVQVLLLRVLVWLGLFVCLFVCNACWSCCWNSLGTAAFVYCTPNLNIAAMSLITSTAWIHFSERFHSVAIWKERRRSDVHKEDCSHDSSMLEAAQRWGRSALIWFKVVWRWGVDTVKSGIVPAWQTKKVGLFLNFLQPEHCLHYGLLCLLTKQNLINKKKVGLISWWHIWSKFQTTWFRSLSNVSETLQEWTYNISCW